MIKEIKYSGYSAQPSDYECPDGQLVTSMNLVNEDNQLKTVYQPSEQVTLPDGYQVLYIHKANLYTHYIVRNDNVLSDTDADNDDNLYCWFDKPTSDDGSTGPDDVTPADIRPLTLPSVKDWTVHQITSVGNTLIFLTDNGLQYLLWENSDYTYLGSHIPELPLSFGLQGYRGQSHSLFLITFGEDVREPEQVGGGSFSDSVKANVTEQVLAQVNKYIADYYTNGHHFIFPFFVRYAYRLYDGSLSHHSAPILMICSTGCTPNVIGGKKRHTEGLNYALIWDSAKMIDCIVQSPVYTLDFAVVHSEKYISELKKWSDIVTSVDIFISAPLYTYDQSGQIERVERLQESKERLDNEYCICRNMSSAGGEDSFSKYYQYHSILSFWYRGIKGNNMPGWFLKLPMKGEKALIENIKNESKFYFLKSYKLDSLSTTRKTIDIEDGYLQSLTAREVMTDDYDSHTLLVAKNAFVYNSRLNISSLTRILPFGFHMSSLLCYTDGFLQGVNGDFSQGVDSSHEEKQQVSMFIYIKKDGKEIVVRSLDYYDGWFGQLSEAEVGQFTPTPYLYYPDAGAYKAVLFWHRWVFDGSVEGTGEIKVFREITLEPHPMLNGAFFFNGWNDVSGTEIPESNVNKGSDTVESRRVSVPNKIYTSEVNNPFVFPATGISTVGTGDVTGICSAARALSEGQFGQFPLYAFTTEGVWALEVSENGTYSARQPITRDVCINTDGIAQLDNAVGFPTDRGIMLIAGSTTTCISESINSDSPFNVLDVPGIDKLYDMLEHDVDKKECLLILPFSTFLKKCRMIYDYVHQRIIVYAPDVNYAYVYSLKSKEWGMMFSDIVSHLNSYPEALAINKANNIVNFSISIAEKKPVKGLFVTRPIKLDMPDVLKTIDTVIQRGYFRKGHVKAVLYGSRDLFNWHTITSSADHIMRGFRGTPYKYFRIALVCNLDKDESLSGCTVSFTPRLTNRLR